MADEKISGMPAATSVSDTDILPIVQTSTNKKATVAILLADAVKKQESYATPDTINDIIACLQAAGLCALILFAFVLPSVAADFGDIPRSLALPAGQSVRRNLANTLFEAYSPTGHTVTFAVDGSGTVLTTGTKNPIKIPFGGTLQGWVMMCKPSGSVTADVYRAADGAGLPVTSIVGGSGIKPAISSDVENDSTSFTSWTSTTLTAKDNLAINLSGITSATYVQLTLYFR